MMSMIGTMVALAWDPISESEWRWMAVPNVGQTSID
jgi:hypothetical protein